METRSRKRRAVVDCSSEDDFIELDGSESDDIMCSQAFDVEVPGVQENSDDKILSDDSSSGGSGSRSFSRALYRRCMKDFQKMMKLKCQLELALEAQAVCE